MRLEFIPTVEKEVNLTPCLGASEGKDSYHQYLFLAVMLSDG